MSRKEDMIVRFSGLKPGKYEYHFKLDREFFEEYENEEILDGEVEISAIMERNERVTMMHFVLRGEITSVCDRCLGTLRLPIEGEEMLNIRFSDTEQTDDENVAILPEGANEIDLSQWLYEYVAVRIPLQHTHAEGECNPEALRFLVDADEEEGPHRAEGETDPRWDALKELK